MGLFSKSKSRSPANVAGPQASGSGPAQRHGSSAQQAVAGAPSSNIASGSASRVYQHQPLEQNHIRLFVLKRSSRYEEPIQIQIRPYPLNKRPKYTALSFVWGDNADRVDLPVEGRSLKVTRTLDLALRGVRRADQDQLMWADQVSINQLDPVEKTQQVRQMYVIYPQATTVLCWLGEDDGTVRQAFGLLRKWAAARGEGRSKEKLRTQVATETMSQISQAHAPQTALQKLFIRPWWRRAWTLQEVCPSETNRPILVCGQHQLSWYEFFQACYTMFQTLNWEERIHAFSSSIVYVLPMLQASWADRETLRLSNLVPVVARREATDSRDKIYALLGMAKKAGLQYPPADYSLTPDQVCIKYTRAIIELDKTLDILFTVSKRATDDRLPSWTIKLDRMTGAAFQMDWHAGGGQFGKRRFQATLRQPPILDPAKGEFDRIIRLQGRPVDNVRLLCSVTKFVDALAAGQQTWSAVLQRTANICQGLGLGSHYAPTNCNVLEAVLETLTTGDFYMAKRDSMDRQRREWNALYISYQRYISAKHGRVSAVSQNTLEAYAQELCSFTPPPPGRASNSTRSIFKRKHGDAVAWLNQKAVTDLLSTIREKSIDRCLFITTNGYVGLGPPNAMRDDRVCLLFGGSTPFILHPLRTRLGTVYQLVDEAYCEGFMMGEGLRPFVRNGVLREPHGGWTRFAIM